MKDRVLVWILRTFFRENMVIYNAWIGAPKDGEQSAMRFGHGDICVNTYFDFRGAPNLCIKRRIG